MRSEITSVIERRRRWPAEEKLRILQEALAPGASVAAIADRHGVAGGLIYRWLRLVRERQMPELALTSGASTGLRRFASQRPRPLDSLRLPVPLHPHAAVLR